MVDSRAEKPVYTRPGEEVWETTTDGTVWYTITDERRVVHERSAGGKAGTRLRIKTTDRMVNMDAVGYGRKGVFENGLLVRIDSGVQDEPNSPDALSRDDLLVGFAKNGNAFRSFVDKLSELNVRRMKDMAEEIDATASQIAYLKQTVTEKFVIQGDTPTYREIKSTPQGVSV
jgi:hypothetical protein